MMEGEKMESHRKGFLRILERVFLPLSLFDPSLLEDLEVLTIFEEITSSKTSFQMTSIY
jgi:hypothetical protein